MLLFVHPAFQQLPEPIQAALLALAEEPEESRENLVRMVIAYRRHLGAVGPSLPVVNLTLAERLADASIALLQGLADETPDTERRLAQVAIRYFVEADDGQEDLISPDGLEDDRLVFNAAAAALGREDLVVMDSFAAD